MGVAASVLLRPNPMTSTSKVARRLFGEFSSAVDDVAEGLDDRQADVALTALERARHLGDLLHEFREVLEQADEGVRLVPL